MASVGDIEHGQDRVGFGSSRVVGCLSAHVDEESMERRTKEIGKFIIGHIAISLSLDISNARTVLGRLTT
jgi:hypothetical protein